MRILAISGSLQAKSTNLALLTEAASVVPPGVEFVLFDGLRDLPHFNLDIDADAVPESVLRWRQALAGSDAVFIASPEYGFSLPGVLKNAIDWVIGSGELEGKVVGITAAVPGPERGRRGLQALRDTLAAVRATIVGGEPIPTGPALEREVAALLQALIEAADNMNSARPRFLELPLERREIVQDVATQTAGSVSEKSAANSGRTEYVEAGPTRFAYRRFGTQPSTPLLLLQRFRGTMDHWDPLFLNLLGSKRELILLDNAGVGLSTGRVPESIQGMAHDAAAFLDRMALNQIDVLGWSMGGCVAQQLALDRPDLVRRLVLAATGPGGVADAPKIPAKVFDVMLKPVNDDEDFLYLFFPETEQGRKEGFAHLQRLEQRSEEPIPPVSSESIMAQAKAVKAFSMGSTATLPRLGEIAQPVLVAGGHADVMIPAYNSFVMAQRLPNAYLILYPNSGHAFHFQHARSFSSQITQFLA